MTEIPDQILVDLGRRQQFLLLTLHHRHIRHPLRSRMALDLC
jgi:hypothetical protein